ncbi:phosphate butyryltransferase [Ectobacillus sp. sgz5001026]|uniref:phosphate butyryltransferase n=1 Tax=Ectobacillus sp. sgz5001026 TaxID=3242473 RepID=UPI0036D33841
MTLNMLVEKAVKQPKKTVAVAAADDEEVMEAIAAAVAAEIANFYLYGNAETISNMMNKYHLNASDQIQVYDATSVEAARLAVQAVSSGMADIVMKGNISTATILKAVLHKEYGLRTGNVLSHVAVFEVPNYDQFITVTDAAMNIAPDLDGKTAILKNAVAVVRALGIEKPKVAPLAAVELVNPAMQATIDAALLTQMNRRGQIKDCVVDGPLALDNAISKIAAAHKGIVSDVAGEADILLVPNIETGNILYKSLVFFANSKVGAIIAGAKAPIVLTSRADSAESKLYSLALAVATARS